MIRKILKMAVECAILAGFLVCISPADPADAQGWNTIPKYSLGASQFPDSGSPKGVGPCSAVNIPIVGGHAGSSTYPGCATDAYLPGNLGIGVASPTHAIDMLISRVPPAGSVVGPRYEVHNTSTTTGGLGASFLYYSNSTHSVNSNDIGMEFICSATPSTSPVQGNYYCLWPVSISPNDITGTWSTTIAELNVVNRGPDMGWVADPTGPPPAAPLTRVTGMLGLIPESNCFGLTCDRVNNITYTLLFNHSSVTSDFGPPKVTKTYNAILGLPNAIGPGGRFMYIAGRAASSPARADDADIPQSPIQVVANWATGIDLSGATFNSTYGLYLAKDHKVGFTNNSTTASYEASEIDASNINLLLRPAGASGRVLSTASIFVGTASFQISGTGGTGTVSIRSAASDSGTWNLNVPITAGTSGQLLTSGGGGSTSMTWTSPSVTVNGQTCTLGSTCNIATPTLNNILTGSGTVWQSVAMSGDATIAAAGGVTLATVNGNVGSFGSATQVGTFTVNAKGLITAAANVTVTPAVGSITGLGTGVSTALGTAVGSAGAFVVNGGALGSPSSAGTIPAFTLGGTISGGGNQINNVIIGTSTPLAGSFTTLASGVHTITSTTAQQLKVYYSGTTGLTADISSAGAATFTSTSSMSFNSGARIAFTPNAGDNYVTFGGGASLLTYGSDGSNFASFQHASTSYAFAVSPNFGNVDPGGGAGAGIPASFLAGDVKTTATVPTDKAGGNFTIGGGRGTGTGSSDVVIQVSPAGTTGNSFNALVEAVRFVGASKRMKFSNSANFTANGTVATTMTSLGPTGASTTIRKWLTIIDDGGAVGYIPVY